MKHFLNFDFDIKKNKGGIIIEGFANAATVDRMKEVIDPSGWNLENYKKNPIVLFDHGKDPTFGYMPIGKALAVEAKDDGLYTKIQLSNSKTEKISAVRDLVEEGILKTFSVGFDPKESQKSADDPDVQVITKAELIETSIVPIPMNQDSTFSLLSKSAKKINSALAKSWLDQKTKAAWTVKTIHDKMFALKQAGYFNEQKVMNEVSEAAKVSLDTLKAVMAGDISPIPDTITVAFSDVLKIDRNILTMELPDMRTKADVDAEKVCYKIEIPKEKYETLDEAKKLVADAGFEILSTEETDTHWIVSTADAAGLDMEGSEAIDMGNGVTGHCAMAKEKETPAETEAKGDSEAYQEFLKEKETAIAGGEDNPPSWVADEEAWAKAKEMAKAADAKDEYAFVVWAYLNKLGGGKKSFHPETKNLAPDDNPYLQESRQTNVLLGALIKEIQGMSIKLNGLADLTLKKAEEVGDKEGDVTPPAKTEEETKLELAKHYQSEMRTMLKRLKV